jgi:hypothetical protein
MKPLRKEIEKIVYERFGAHYIFTLSDEALKDIADELETLFKSRTLEIIGKDENEVQDMDRQLYFVGKNDLRREQRERLK